MKLKTKDVAEDPFFGLKLIAYYRTGLSVNDEDVNEEAIVQFAKWQICKIKNILWNDPVWDHYTNPEILIEFFSIKFDEDEKLRKTFEASLVVTKKADLDWLERAEKKYLQEIQDKIKGGAETPEPPEEFEDTF